MLHARSCASRGSRPTSSVLIGRPPSPARTGSAITHSARLTISAPRPHFVDAGKSHRLEVLGYLWVWRQDPAQAFWPTVLNVTTSVGLRSRPSCRVGIDVGAPPR
jgi:hypothetical protein